MPGVLDVKYQNKAFKKSSGVSGAADGGVDDPPRTVFGDQIYNRLKKNGDMMKNHCVSVTKTFVSVCVTVALGLLSERMKSMTFCVPGSRLAHTSGA